MQVKYYLLPNHTVDIQLAKRITILTGDSGTGKSLIAETCPSQLSDGTQVFKYTVSSYINGLIQNINEVKNALFILDRFDMYSNDDIFKAIAEDKNNYYIIMSRLWDGFRYADYDLKEVSFDESTNTFTLKDFI